ncbi:hypothetical protein TNCT_88051, partial [Trichonephila clavata]
EPCSKNVEEQFKGYKERIMERKPLLRNQRSIQGSHPRGTCLRAHAPSKGIAQRKTPRGKLKGGLGKHGNIPPLTNVGRFDVEISCCR